MLIDCEDCILIHLHWSGGQALSIECFDVPTSHHDSHLLFLCNQDCNYIFKHCGLDLHSFHFIVSDWFDQRLGFQCKSVHASNLSICVGSHEKEPFASMAADRGSNHLLYLVCRLCLSLDILFSGILSIYFSFFAYLNCLDMLPCQQGHCLCHQSVPVDFIHACKPV
jgi:hypothetical protein